MAKIREMMAKLFGVKVKSNCPEGKCSFDVETNVYTIRGKMYGGELFDVLANEFDSEHIFRVVVRADKIFTIKKLPLA